MATPETHPSLLVRMRDDGDHEAWSRFIDVYSPVIYGFLQQQGLQDADAADLTQDVMASVADAIKSFHYQPKRGRFRSWLFTVVQNKLRNFWRGSAKRPAATGDSQSHRLIQEQPDHRGDALDTWEHAYERQLFVRAAELARPKVQENTWQAFWSTIVQGEPTAQVAARLAMSPAAVRLAKARVIARIRNEIQMLEGDSQ